MNNEDPQSQSDPELRVLDERKGQRAGGGRGQERLGNVELVEVLKPEKHARFEAKTYEPEVADILENEEEEIDTEEGWGENTIKAPPLGWFVLAGTIILGLAIWAALTVYWAQSEISVVEQQKGELEQMRAEELVEVRKILAAMEKTMKGYLGATTVDQMSPYVRHPERVVPLMREYYKDRSMEPSSFSRIESTRSLGLETLSFVNVKAVMADDSRKNLILQQLEGGAFVVDWEADICHQPMDWKTFIDERPKTAMEMRVKLKPDNFHAYEFRDEGSFDCYQLTAKGHDHHVFGFVKSGSAVARKLARFAENNQITVDEGNPQPLILRIRFPENSASKKCVWIDELVAPRWVKIDVQR